jgi:hypothetical protein
MTLQDKAGNRIVYNFLELLTFELIDWVKYALST